VARRYRNLIAQIADKDNLWNSYHKASMGRRSSSGYLNFKEYDAAAIDRLHELLISGEYRPGAYREFWVYEPKPRKIAALPFRDRVVQHALIGVIGPLFEAGMLPQSHACRKGMGMHSGAIRCQQLIRQLGKSGRPVFALKTDFSRYFHSIKRDVLWQQIDRKISCRATRNLIEQFTPRDGVGIPIGNLSSQLWANVYGTQVDRLLCQTFKTPAFIRYMDDIVVLHNSRAFLEELQGFMEMFCNHAMGLRFSKWSIRPASLGVNFLGYRIFRDYKLMRKQSVTRAKLKIRRYITRREWDKLERFWPAWKGHAQWADSHNLINHLNHYAREHYVRTHEHGQCALPG
jgi:hypothetical protein